MQFRKRKDFFTLISSLPFFLVFIMPLSFADSVGTGSISGTVIPNDTSIAVQAIRDFSIAAQTNVTEDGAYTLSNLSPGTYGLLFIRNDDESYIYNDKANQFKWMNGNILNKENIEFINLNEGEQLSGYNINLEAERPDFRAHRISLHFYSNLSLEERESIIYSSNLSIIDEWRPSFDSTVIIYTVRIPQDKTALEVSRSLQSSPSVNAAIPQELLPLGSDKKEESENNSIATKVENESTKNNVPRQNIARKNQSFFPYLLLSLIFFISLILILNFRRKKK